MASPLTECPKTLNIGRGRRRVISVFGVILSALAQRRAICDLQNALRNPHIARDLNLPEPPPDRAAPRFWL